MKRLPRVAVLIESSRAFGRGLIEGIARYSRHHGPWSMYFEPQALGVAPPAWLETWDGDGILVRIDDQRMADAVLATGLPALDLRGRLPDLPLPFIGGDNEQITKLAFDHLRERGLTQFAFCGVPEGQMRTLDLRRQHFIQHVQAAGYSCEVYSGRRSRKGEQRSGKTKGQSVPAIDFGSLDWDSEQNALAKWVSGLSRPIGIMACHDPRGYQLVDACRRADVSIPDEVAVVGVDNDPVLCSMADPPMTSIDSDGLRIGHHAASWLDRMMRGERGPESPVLIGPRRLHARRSSDMLAVSDPDLASAMAFIRDYACDGIQVGSVVRHVATSRSVLERRFRKHLGRTIKSEILRVQLEKAQQLLSETDLPLAALAGQTGFSTEKYFSDVFVRETGVRPTAWRRKMRPDSSES